MVQEALTAIWKAISTGQYPGDGEGFAGWCIVVGRNGMRNYLRDRLRGPQKGENNDLASEELPQTGRTVDKVGIELVHELELAYHEGEIYAALDALTPQQREYVVLRFWGDVDAATLNKHFETRNSASIWQRAKPKLALALAHLADAA